MASISIAEGKMKSGGSIPMSQKPITLLEEMKLLKEMQDQSGSRRCINSELWHACAGPLVSLPQLGSLVYYFPQGHSEQVAVSTKRPATSQIPNYPNLPSQLMCQVHNVTLHADKETDEIFAQMSLQPVNTEKDMFPVPDFGLKPSKHPSEFFCKTLTASDTSTHGGFSVPRRAAEKLFPPLDFTMQPPTQELIVRDLHDNTWTFRHIYRGQPKRHLLTTGWSLFVGAKRLKAGDSVLFIRDEKSQLLVGIRRANRQQTTLPSSVLSADSMHIGILAAAAHANANRSSFTIFYNPRACPSEFVIPYAKYRKAVYGTRISVGMRFGMMFETEESGKRRYMGTIICVSDLDPIRWPGSKWRNLQVEWDEPGCVDKQNRVSSWEIETPESLFIFPSLTSGLKRPFFAPDTEWGSLIKRPLIPIPENGSGNLLPYPSYQNICSEQLIQMMLKPQIIPSLPRDSEPKAVLPVQDLAASQIVNEKEGPDQSGSLNSVDAMEKVKPPTRTEKQAPVVSEPDRAKSDSDIRGQSDGVMKPPSNHHPNQPTVLNPNPLGQVMLQSSSAWPPPQKPKLEPHNFHPQPTTDGLSPFNNGDDWLLNSSTVGGFLRPQGGPVSMFGVQDPTGTFMDPIAPILPQMGQDIWDHSRYLSQIDQLTPLPDQDPSGFLRDLSDESNNQSGIYGCLNLDANNGNGSSLMDPSVSSAILEDLCGMKDSRFQNPPECMFGGGGDVQSQITTASLADTQTLSRHDFPDSSGGTSSSNVDFGDSSLLKSSSWQPVAQPLRTYTKVQKTGSVGRSIDVTNFKNYAQLLSAIECMFGLEGLLSDPRGSGWKLVYVDYENDVLLVGDDPWEEFVGCVRCIRILSPAEVQQMSEEGMKLLNSTAAAAQGMSSIS